MTKARDNRYYGNYSLDSDIRLDRYFVIAIINAFKTGHNREIIVTQLQKLVNNNVDEIKINEKNGKLK